MTQIPWQGAPRHDARFDWRRQRLHPGGADFLERTTETDAINVRIGGKPGDQHGTIVARAFAVGWLGEQEGAPVALGNAAAILPAHQGMHFGIFVDRLVDDDQQAGAMQRQNMVVQIGIAALASFAAVAFELARNFTRPAHTNLARLRQHRHQPGRLGKQIGIAIEIADHLETERHLVELEQRL